MIKIMILEDDLRNEDCPKKGDNPKIKKYNFFDFQLSLKCRDSLTFTFIVLYYQQQSMFSKTLFFLPKSFLLIGIVTWRKELIGMNSC